jgi:hypothetical protein
MRTSVIKAAVVCALLTFAVSATAQERLVRFEGGIGSQPWARMGAATLIPNDVNAVQPGGRPWVISRLSADVRVDGRISVDGRGLLLAGGDNIGRNGGQRVRARLLCEVLPAPAAPAPRVFTRHDSQDPQGVALEPDGDFRIEDHLNPMPPNPCNNAILLIVNVPPPNTNASWFAAGIPKE